MASVSPSYLKDGSSIQRQQPTFERLINYKINIVQKRGTKEFRRFVSCLPFFQCILLAGGVLPSSVTHNWKHLLSACFVLTRLFKCSIYSKSIQPHGALHFWKGGDWGSESEPSLCSVGSRFGLEPPQSAASSWLSCSVFSALAILVPSYQDSSLWLSPFLSPLTPGFCCSCGWTEAPFAHHFSFLPHKQVPLSFDYSTIWEPNTCRWQIS